MIAIEVVVADGRILRTGTKCVNDVAGFSLKDMIISSEECFGVITRITLKLIPKPAAKRTLLGMFDNMTAAAETGSAIIRQRKYPTHSNSSTRSRLNASILRPHRSARRRGGGALDGG